jgi:hypothetical protein
MGKVSLARQLLAQWIYSCGDGALEDLSSEAKAPESEMAGTFDGLAARFLTGALSNSASVQEVSAAPNLHQLPQTETLMVWPDFSSKVPSRSASLRLTAE